MSRFKAGDLAVIIGSRKDDSPNLGRVVELKIMLNPGEKYIAADGIRRLMNAVRPCWLVSGEGLMAYSQTQSKWIDIGGQSLVHESHLMPLRGDFTPEQSKEQERPVNA